MPCQLARLIFLAGLVILLPTGAAAQSVATGSDDASRPRSTDRSFSDNLRWTIDSSAQRWNSDASGANFDQYVVGLDLHKVFSNGRRDIGTLILQPYAVWLPDKTPRPKFFDGNDAALSWRIANFNWAVKSRGRMNVRLGHFEIPFGLEHEINTNGTLRQYSNGKNLGMKADWGIGVNGQFTRWQYEIGATRGTGQEFHDTADPYAFSARIGTPFDRPFGIGAAVFRGRVDSPGGPKVIDRVGLDLKWEHGPVGLMIEASRGNDFNAPVTNALVELNWTSRTESLLVYAQRRRFEFGSGAFSQISEVASAGVRWLQSNRLSLAVQVSQQETSASLVDAEELRLHFRFRR